MNGNNIRFILYFLISFALFGFIVNENNENLKTDNPFNNGKIKRQLIIKNLRKSKSK